MLSHFTGLDIEPNPIILHRHGLYTYPVESSQCTHTVVLNPVRYASEFNGTQHIDWIAFRLVNSEAYLTVSITDH